MFQSFERYNRILVTGPMRSGTTICAAMISRDTGKQLVLEERMFSTWPHSRGIVVQAPVLLPEAKRLASDGWFVVVMRRALVDVVPSLERFMSGRITGEPCRKIAEDQLKMAEELGRWVEEVGPGQVVDYETLRLHPMWVEDRSEFGPRDFCRRESPRYAAG